MFFSLALRAAAAEPAQLFFALDASPYPTHSTLRSHRSCRYVRLDNNKKRIEVLTTLHLDNTSVAQAMAYLKHTKMSDNYNKTVVEEDGKKSGVVHKNNGMYERERNRMKRALGAPPTHSTFALASLVQVRHPVQVRDAGRRQRAGGGGG